MIIKQEEYVDDGDGMCSDDSGDRSEKREDMGSSRHKGLNSEGEMVAPGRAELLLLACAGCSLRC